ncbi:LiaI-LiaF-like domain-containing protein [Patescibacteria group bacterium]
MDEQQHEYHGDKPERSKPRITLGPILLIVVGVLWLLSNLGYSWGEDVWIPVIIIIVGVWLIYKNTKN